MTKSLVERGDVYGCGPRCPCCTNARKNFEAMESRIEELEAEREERIDKWMEIVEEKDQLIAKLEKVREALRDCGKIIAVKNTSALFDLSEALAACEEKDDD